MKKLTSLFFTFALLLGACNNKPKDKSPESNNATKNATTNTTSTETGMPTNDMAKLMEEMKKLPALTTDQLKAMLPESLEDMKRANFSVNERNGLWYC